MATKQEFDKAVADLRQDAETIRTLLTDSFGLKKQGNEVVRAAEKLIECDNRCGVNADSDHEIGSLAIEFKKAYFDNLLADLLSGVVGAKEAEKAAKNITEEVNEAIYAQNQYMRLFKVVDDSNRRKSPQTLEDVILQFSPELELVVSTLKERGQQESAKALGDAGDTLVLAMLNRWNTAQSLGGKGAAKKASSDCAERLAPYVEMLWETKNFMQSYPDVEESALKDKIEPLIAKMQELRTSLAPKDKSSQVSFRA